MPRPKFRPLSQFPKEALDIFWPYVLTGEPHECWPYLGSEGPGGYGTFFINGQLWIASRIAYWDHYGDDPGQLMVCHHCDNPPCCNWRHLFAGDYLANARDAVQKGRYRSNPLRGEAAPQSKLTEVQVREIRQLKGKLTYREIGARYTIGAMHAWSIVNGKLWTHIK